MADTGPAGGSRPAEPGRAEPERSAEGREAADAGPAGGGGRAAPPAAGEPGHPRPGQVSALLEQLARPPEPEAGGWIGPAIGTSVGGRFDLIREIGRGGFGVVYEARDRELGRLVALKVIRPGALSLTEARREWLRREAETAAQLSHANIVRLYDVGTGESGPGYLVLEMLHGETLQERLARGPLPVAEAVALAVEVARALAHAHANRVLHRDLKPSNVFLTEDGEVKVLDFGLAHVFGTSGMGGGGTPGYMAPEQWRGDPEDERTDVFGLGVLLFETLTGRLPYRVSRDRSEALDPGPPPELPADVPPPLAALARSALSKDPRERPRHGRAMLDGLVEVQRALSAGERRSPPAASGAPGRRRRRLAAVAALLAAAGLAAAWAWNHSRRRVPPAPPIRVVVADVSNETGDPHLDNLSRLLIISLRQSRLFEVLTHQQIVDLAGDPARIDEAAWRRLALRAEAKALLTGAVRRLDRVYVMTLQAVDPSSGESRFDGKEEGTGDSSVVLGLLDRLSDRFREAMSEREAAVRRSSIKVEDAVTRSLEAFQHYVRSQECMYHPSFGQSCAGELRQALAIDPTFALAYYQLAVWEERHGGARASEEAATEAAVRYLDRVPPKEQALIRAWKAHSDGDDDRSLAILTRLGEAQPRDPEAPWEAGDLLYHRSDFAGAVHFFEKLLALDPAQAWGLDHLVHSLGGLHRTGDLRARAAAWAAGPQGPTVLHALSVAQAWLGDYPAAAAAARREAEAGGGLAASEDLLFTGIAAGDWRGVEAHLGALAAPGSPAPAIGYYALAALDGYQGRRRQGLSRFEAMVRDLGPEAADSIFHGTRAYYLAGGGKPGPVWEEVRTLLDLDPGAAAAHAVTLAWLGDLEHAALAAVHLRPGTPRRETYDAVVLWQRGRQAEALRRLREISARSAFDADMALAPTYLLGDLSARAGADEEAVAALAEFRSLFLPIMMWRSWAYPRSLVLSASSLARLGRRAEATELLDRLLADWRGADPDLPLLGEARALRARLGSAKDRPASP